MPTSTVSATDHKLLAANESLKTGDRDDVRSPRSAS